MADIKAAAIITAGGTGKRFRGGGIQELPKQFIPLSGKPLIVYSIETFENSASVSELTIVVPGELVEYTKREIMDKYGFRKVSSVIAGGSERQDSVIMGFNSFSNKPDIVAVHDGVRPFVSIQTIEEVIRQASQYGGAIAAVSATDTIKKAGPGQLIDTTLPRGEIWLAQTPQAFRYEILKEAFEKAAKDNYLGTDEAELVERLGMEVKLVDSTLDNIKITNPRDMELAHQILNTGLKVN